MKELRGKLIGVAIILLLSMFLIWEQMEESRKQRECLEWKSTLITDSFTDGIISKNE